MKIAQIKELPNEFESLESEASQEGHSFLSKMRSEWIHGQNRFSRDGEALFVALSDAGQLIGVGGLNIDPYVDDNSVGRVRHVFVSAKHRGAGIGWALLEEVLKCARGRFSLLRLRTQNLQAVRFYQAFGFRIDAEFDDPTHVYLKMCL